MSRVVRRVPKRPPCGVPRYGMAVARIDIPAGEGGDAVQVWSLRPEMGRAVSKLTQAVYHQSILPVRVREAARMRIAQLNDCPI